MVRTIEVLHLLDSDPALYNECTEEGDMLDQAQFAAWLQTRLQRRLGVRDDEVDWNLATRLIREHDGHVTSP